MPSTSAASVTLAPARRSTSTGVMASTSSNPSARITSTVGMEERNQLFTRMHTHFYMLAGPFRAAPETTTTDEHIWTQMELRGEEPLRNAFIVVHMAPSVVELPCLGRLGSSGAQLTAHAATGLSRLDETARGLWLRLHRCRRGPGGFGARIARDRTHPQRREGLPPE